MLGRAAPERRTGTAARAPREHAARRSSGALDAAEAVRGSGLSFSARRAAWQPAAASDDAAPLHKSAAARVAPSTGLLISARVEERRGSRPLPRRAPRKTFSSFGIREA